VHSKPGFNSDDEETEQTDHSIDNSWQNHTRTSSMTSIHEAYPSSPKDSLDDLPSPPLFTLEYYNFLIKQWRGRSKEEDLRSLESSTSSSQSSESSHSAQQRSPIVSAMPVVAGPLVSELSMPVFVGPLVSETHTPQVAVCTKEPLKPIYDPDFELKKISKQLLRCQKYALASSVISINAVLIFCSWYYLLHLRN